MPTYEYECDACGHRFDEFQNFSDPLLTKCPECKKKKLRRLFGSGASIIFKGSGFYETDYRSDSYKSAQKAETDSSKPASDSKAKTDTKPAAESKPATQESKASKSSGSGKND